MFYKREKRTYHDLCTTKILRCPLKGVPHVATANPTFPLPSAASRGADSIQAGEESDVPAQDKTLPLTRI
jgi:hypothetical protein